MNFSKWLEYGIVFICVLAYAVMNAYFLTNGGYMLVILPVMALVFYFLVRFPRFLFYIIVLITPFSFLYQPSSKVAMYLPTEPIIVCLMGLYILRQLIDPTLDKRILKHPLTIIILINLIWMFITSFTSTMPLVSFKYFLVRLWYITVFYFMALDIFRNYGNIKKFIWLYIIGLSLIIIYATFHHYTIGISRHTAINAPQPFFKDHTIYGATVALILPAVFSFFFRRKPFGHGTQHRILAFILCPVFLTGLAFSFSRAAWVSVGLILVALVIFWLRIKFKTIIITACIVISLVLAFWTQILIFFKENEATSGANIQQHIQSIYNITNDASNTERINRWASAYRMFKERPVFGFGPGTYQFQYAPFQRYYQKTQISTNFGDVGNAHSEYMGPLAEFGLLGMLSKLALMLMTIYTGMQLYYKGRNDTVRITALTITLCLITYFAHGFLNNFLNYDKAAVPFFGFVAILTALDVYYNKPLGSFEDEKPEEGKDEQR